MKVRNNILKTLGMASVLFVAAGCDMSDFGDINKNPNSINVPVTSALLTNALLDFDDPATTGSMRGGLYCQYFAETQYTETSLYATPQVSWDGVYAGSQYDLQNIINNNTNPETAAYAALNGSNNNQIALARILKAYRYLAITDSWGDIPLTEALLEKNKPKYDTQQEVYNAIFKELKEAVAQFDGGDAPKGDIVHNGNITNWKKFANTVRLIMALRIAKVDAATGRTQFNDALKASGGVIETNAENTNVEYPGGTYKNPWFDLYNGRKDYGISDTFVGIVGGMNDPRVKSFGQPNAKGEVVPMTYGLTRDEAVAYTNSHSDYSFILNESYRQANSVSFVLTAAHAYLARAEAAQLGWTTESAKDMYSKGIEMSWKQWNAFTTQAAFDSYMNSAAVSITENPLAKIQLQRYIAFYPNGHMGWSEWRRTGIPALTPSKNATNSSKQIPRRYVYGANEASLNGDNYKTAVGRLTGGDTQDAKMWWDK